ncbi:MAG TPA: hypothetical protein VGF99_18055, partial [Myxococcota bacterium]
MTEPTWQEKAKQTWATWTTSTSSDQRVHDLTMVLGVMFRQGAIAEGLTYAEGAFELALRDDVSAANASEAFLCLAEIYEWLDRGVDTMVIEDRWTERFGTAPPTPRLPLAERLPPVFGIAFDDEGAITGVRTSPDDPADA